MGLDLNLISFYYIVLHIPFDKFMVWILISINFCCLFILVRADAAWAYIFVLGAMWKMAI